MLQHKYLQMCSLSTPRLYRKVCWELERWLGGLVTVVKVSHGCVVKRKGASISTFLYWKG